MLPYQDIIETLATGVIVQFDEEVSMRIAWWEIADCWDRIPTRPK